MVDWLIEWLIYKLFYHPIIIKRWKAFLSKHIVAIHFNCTFIYINISLFVIKAHWSITPESRMKDNMSIVTLPFLSHLLVGLIRQLKKQIKYCGSSGENMHSKNIAFCDFLIIYLNLILPHMKFDETLWASIL